MRPRSRWGLGVAAAACLVGGVVALAWSRAEPPARCAPGMVALGGARCCGEGQQVERGGCVGAPARCAADMTIDPRGCIAVPRIVPLASGTLTIGPGDWEAQGVVDPRVVYIPPFRLDAFEVTEDRWAACVASAACPPLPLTGEPGRALGGVTPDEAAAYCRWAGGTLPTSDQLAFAAAGRTGRRYAWGDTGAVCRRAAWGLVTGPCGSGAVAPELAGAHPDGASPEGIFDLAGNVAEWAMTPGGGVEVRGGSFASAAASGLRAWQRAAAPPGARAPDVGFRCAYP